MNETEVLARFVRWLDARVVAAGRGDSLSKLENEPRNKLWLGRLASEAAVIASPLGDRGERLEPCAMGIRVLPAERKLSFSVRVRCCAWLRQQDRTWKKTPHIAEDVAVQIGDLGVSSHGSAQLESALTMVTGAAGLSCEVRTELERNLDGSVELTVLVVNTSPETHRAFADTTLYEVSASITGLARTEPAPVLWTPPI